VPGEDGRCHLHMEFTEPVSFDVMEVRGAPEERLTWSEAVLDGKSQQMFRDYYAGDQLDGKTTYIFFYTRQRARSIDFSVPPSGSSGSSFVFSDLQLAQYHLGLALRSPFRRFHQ
jgi:hypothetical protein